MLSYRHAFHAGNHADVLKHLMLVQTIVYMQRKEKPFVYIDTHAGGGVYNLRSDWAQKNREYENGIGRIWQRADLPAAMSKYVDIVTAMNPSSELCQYPGSPWIVKQLMRPGDKCRLYELHSSEVENLQACFSDDQSVKIEKSDGFSALKSQLPPRERRAVVLMDPSYENKQDFSQVVAVLKDAYHRFATGVYMIWYPIIWSKYLKQLEDSLRNSGISNILCCELHVASENASGLTGSGMFVVNPPWVLADDMRHSLPYLADVLAQRQVAHYRLEMLVEQ